MGLYNICLLTIFCFLYIGSICGQVYERLQVLPHRNIRLKKGRCFAFPRYNFIVLMIGNNLHDEFSLIFST